MLHCSIVFFTVATVSTKLRFLIESSLVFNPAFSHRPFETKVSMNLEPGPKIFSKAEENASIFCGMFCFFTPYVFSRWK